MKSPDEHYYVSLTGAKNNAGDYLIKYRSKQLLSALRPDRALVDIDGWKPLGRKQLEVINKSQALILMGGPALQQKMRPQVYRLVDDLDKITVPITTMGIGWYSRSGEWKDTRNYPLNNSTRELLQRIADDKLVSSVRDYHTLNVMQSMGFGNYLMTGCPAMFSLDHIGMPISPPSSVRKLGFSLGVSMKRSKLMGEQMRNVILAARDMCQGAELEVAFHHAVDESYLGTHGASTKLYEEHQRFICWLESENIQYSDVSGSAENMMDFYNRCDFHVGYRVHAHIFMSSISRPSLLLVEDGRGEALRGVLGGVSLRAYDRVKNSPLRRLLNIFRLNVDTMEPAPGLVPDYEQVLEYERSQGVRFTEPRQAIDIHFPIMKRFLCQLP